MQITTQGFTPGLSFQEIFSNVPLVAKDHTDFYLTTNEHENKAVLSSASKLPLTAGKVLFFTSCMFGLNLASVRGSVEKDAEIDYLLSVDQSGLLASFWEDLGKIVVNSERQEAITKVHRYILANADTFYPKSSGCPYKPVEIAEKAFTKLSEEIAEGSSWLSTNDQYARIKKVFVANRFAFVRADFNDPDAMKAITLALKKHNITIDCLYLSNVKEFSEVSGKLRSFQIGQGLLKDSCTRETFVVDTVPRELRRTDTMEKLTQQLRHGFFETSVSEFFPPSPVPVQNRAPDNHIYVTIDIDSDVVLNPAQMQQLLSQMPLRALFGSLSFNS